jgi:phosphatidylglycerophosphate synthase
MFKISHILEVDKIGPVNNYSFRFFFRPISIIPTYILFKLKITPNQVTYFRIFVFFILIIHPIIYLKVSFLNFYLYILFIQILDFCDGNLARIYKTNNLYGKLIDGLGDTLIPISYIYLSIYIHGYDLNNKIFHAVFFILIVYFITIIIELRVSNYSSMVKASRSKGTEGLKVTIESKKIIRSVYESVQSSQLIFILFFIILNEINLLIILLTILSLIGLIDSLRTLSKNRVLFKSVEFSTMSKYLNED